MKPLPALLAMRILTCAFLLSHQLFAQTQPIKATIEAPTDAKLLAAKYYRGDGTGYNVTIVLAADGTYTSEWHGCLGKYGDANGKWTLTKGTVHFDPVKEDGMMKGHLKNLEVMKLKDAWILVPTEKRDREFYDKWGVSRYACFQKAPDKK